MKHLPYILTIIFLFFGCSKGGDSFLRENSPNFGLKKYNVTITINPNNGGAVFPNGAQYDENTTATFTASPSQNYVFKNWSGSNTSSDNPLLLFINSNKNLTANFEQQVEEQTRDIDGDGVNDDEDLDDNTRSGVPVDDNGVMLNPIYLDDNGVTIKSEEWGIDGDIGIINGEEYLIVGNYSLRTIINSGQDISNICTSLVTDMTFLFDYERPVNGSISSWDVSSVTDMHTMFWNAHSFNSDISSWDVSSVNDMTKVFRMAHSFNQDISDWDVSNVSEGFVEMFHGTNSLSEYNMCAIHNSFSTNENWSYDWDQFCFIPETIEELQVAVNLWENDNQSALETYGPINEWQVSAVTNMSGLFENKTEFKSIFLLDRAKRAVKSRSMLQMKVNCRMAKPRL